VLNRRVDLVVRNAPGRLIRGEDENAIRIVAVPQHSIVSGSWIVFHIIIFCESASEPKYWLAKSQFTEFSRARFQPNTIGWSNLFVIFFALTWALLACADVIHLA
jgi:hypothetical protein